MIRRGLTSRGPVPVYGFLLAICGSRLPGSSPQRHRSNRAVFVERSFLPSCTSRKRRTESFLRLSSNKSGMMPARLQEPCKAFIAHLVREKNAP